jgi:hypothetical protein
MELEMLLSLTMNTKRLLIVAVAVTVNFLLAIVYPPLSITFSLAALGFGVFIGARWWKQLPFRQKAKYVSDIRRADYFHHVPGPQLENWLLAAFTARGFVLLGDPALGRSLDQGYAWRSGKKVALFIQQERPLQERDLVSICALKNKCKVDSVFVFSPFSSAPKSKRPGLEIVAGQKFLSWMSVLDGVRPVNIGKLPPQNCSCGAPQEEHLSRAGEPLLICTQYPDCREAPQPGFGKVSSAVAA